MHAETHVFKPLAYTLYAAMKALMIINICCKKSQNTVSNPDNYSCLDMTIYLSATISNQRLGAFIYDTLIIASRITAI